VGRKGGQEQGGGGVKRHTKLKNGHGGGGVVHPRYAGVHRGFREGKRGNKVGPNTPGSRAPHLGWGRNHTS